MAFCFQGKKEVEVGELSGSGGMIQGGTVWIFERSNQTSLLAEFSQTHNNIAGSMCHSRDHGMAKLETFFLIL